MNATAAPTSTTKRERRFQSYRGTWAWLIQRLSAIGLFLLIPLKIYTGWAARDRVEMPDFLLSAKKLHYLSKVSEGLDIALLLFFLLHGFYGLRVILIDFGVIREDRWFWRTMIVALTLFGTALWFVYLRATE